MEKRRCRALKVVPTFENRLLCLNKISARDSSLLALFELKVRVFEVNQVRRKSRLVRKPTVHGPTAPPAGTKRTAVENTAPNKSKIKRNIKESEGY